MYYCYILRSKQHPKQRYIGSSSNVEARLEDHNANKSSHTKKYAPWEIETIVGFQSKEKALKFEQYLKTGSGHAFASRHF